MSTIDEDDVFFIKQGDLEPPLDLQVSGSSGDLSGVSSWTVTGSRNGDLVFEDTAANFTPGANATSGVVTHDWVAGETDILGSMDVEATAIWPGDRPQTFPPRKYCRVVVSKKLP
jgi:hypothetical protein